jgi:predicted RNA-binding Zn ribbon-like protein
MDALREVSNREPVAADELVLRFLNTRADAAGNVELFGTPADFTAWARRQDLLPPEAVVTESDAVAARELRDALVTVLLAHSGDKGVTDEQVAIAETHLAHASARYPLTGIVTAHGGRLAATSAGAPGVLGTVLAAVTRMALHDDWARFKACCNSPCHAGFVDRTRNRSARYCSPGCGSQASMRALRERRRQAGA